MSVPMMSIRSSKQIKLPLRDELSSIELCAGAGGQALGLEQAGFAHESLVEIDADACKTLTMNRPSWSVINGDLRNFDPRPYKGVDLVAGGLPCPPFSVAGKQLGEKDERNLFPTTIDIIDEIQPNAVLIENVRGFLSPVFDDYREQLKLKLKKLGYKVEWKLLHSSDYGVPQLRPRVAIVALREELSDLFAWPESNQHRTQTVGEALADLMAERGWPGAKKWARGANSIAPTIVGGSKKHGGPDLGPTRARLAWESLGVNGKSIAEHAPDKDHVGPPRLTVRMVARLQGFPDDWEIYGRKTTAYRQVGNAFPPPVARALATQLKLALTAKRQFKVVA
jgi:DNA (cytosine-5)-methyltransferase 1